MGGWTKAAQSQREKTEGGGVAAWGSGKEIEEQILETNI